MTKGLVALSILLAVHLPVMMVVGTVLMERAERKIAGGQERGMVLRLVRQIVQVNLVRNPLVIGLAAGVVSHLPGSHTMPATVAMVVGQIAGVAGPVGADIAGHGASEIWRLRQCRHCQRYLRPSSFCCFRLACGLPITLLGLAIEWTAALVLISSVPTGVSAWLIANRFGVGHSLAASAIR